LEQKFGFFDSIIGISKCMIVLSMEIMVILTQRSASKGCAEDEEKVRGYQTMEINGVDPY